MQISGSLGGGDLSGVVSQPSSPFVCTPPSRCLLFAVEIHARTSSFHQPALTDPEPGFLIELSPSWPRQELLSHWQSCSNLARRGCFSRPKRAEVKLPAAFVDWKPAWWNQSAHSGAEDWSACIHARGAATSLSLSCPLFFALLLRRLLRPPPDAGPSPPLPPASSSVVGLLNY